MVFLQIFLEYALLFLEIKRKQKKEEKANNFQEAKVQPQGVGWLLLDFFSNFSLVLLIKKKRVQHIRNTGKHIIS